MNSTSNSVILNELIAFIKALGSIIIGTAFVGIIVGCLFAPAFAPIIRVYVERQYRTFKGHALIEAVDDQMFKINIILWIICILSWTFALYCNLK